jgi:hypothetical protein
MHGSDFVDGRFSDSFHHMTERTCADMAFEKAVRMRTADPYRIESRRPCLRFNYCGGMVLVCADLNCSMFVRTFPSAVTFLTDWSLVHHEAVA